MAGSYRNSETQKLSDGDREFLFQGQDDTKAVPMAFRPF
jgi:hypothetical protein